jgi:hypothetical protein
MQESPRDPDPGRPEGALGAPVYEKPLGENAVLKFLQRPRIVLLLLIVWSLLTALIEAWPESGVFFDVKSGQEIDGALGGGILLWQGIPLALLYFLSFRNPQENRSVFWVALVQQGAAVAANLFQWGTGTFTAESIIVPVAVSAGLGALIFVNVFGRDEMAEMGRQPAA